MSFEARPDLLRAENYAPVNVWRNLVSLSAAGWRMLDCAMIRKKLWAAMCLATLAAIPLATTPQNTAPSPPAQSPTPAAPSLAAQIAALVSDPAVSRDHWGIYVTALEG